MTSRQTIVVAIGGNALVSQHHESIIDQLHAVERLAGPLVDLVAGGHRLVVTHGNGPQVGYILRRSELAIDHVPPVPIDFAVADTQGAIGHMFLLALRNELVARGFTMPVTALLTTVVVNARDPAFAAPTKPIGSLFAEADARTLAQRFGWHVADDAGRGWRRVVASPVPIAVVEARVIVTLLDAGGVVVAAGGGGIPVIVDPARGHERVEAVVDKDLTSALVADAIGADVLVFVTSEGRLVLGWGTDHAVAPPAVSADELVRRLASGEFDQGSIGPKLRASIGFVDSSTDVARRAIIAGPSSLDAALGGVAGTTITASR